jgi:protein involved in polysaccharide export with SLBB domain
MSVVSPDDARGNRRRTTVRATMAMARTGARAGATAGAAACALLSACTTPVPLPPAPIVSQPVTGEVAQLNPYKLQVGDQLDIKFPLNPELRV